MDEIDRYIREVLRNIPFPIAARERIEADLRAHLESAQAEGDAPQAVISRMGSPVEVAEELMSQVPLQYAGFWRRLAACAVDMILIFVLAAIPAFAGVALSSLVPQHPAGFDYVVGAAIILAVVVCALAVVGVAVLYFPILEGRFGRTLGKRLLKLWVLKENGLPIGYTEAFLRRLSYYFEIMAVDALFIPFTPKRQRAFDIVARTVVIRE
jgi:uncharacterized RDD family membrane protein YckC